MLVGDAELDEGTNHEALELAARLGLDGLTVVVVDNPRRPATPYRTGSRRGSPSKDWQMTTVDGRDHDDLEKALSEPAESAPERRGRDVVDGRRSRG